MARVGLEGAVVYLLRERDGGFDYHVGGTEHVRDAARALRDGDAVSDREADVSAADHLRYRDEDGDAALRARAEHRARVAAPARDCLEGQAALAAEREYLLRELLGAQPHRIRHVRRGLDDHVALGGVALREQLAVEQHFFSELVELFVRHVGELEDVAARHLLLVHAELRRSAHLDAVERAAHLVVDDCGARRDAVDDALRYELGDERRDALVEVRAAAGDDGDLAAPFLGFDDFVYRRVESFARAFVEAVVKFLY